MQATGPVPASLDMIGKTCPLCRTPIQAGAAVVVCPACRNPHHAACWHKSGGCGVYGCARARAIHVQPTPQPMPQPTAMGAPSPVPAGHQGSCPRCGYIYGPMEKTCRRCASGAAPPIETGRPAHRSGGFPWVLIVVFMVALALVGGVIFLAINRKEGSVVLAYKFKPGQENVYTYSSDGVGKISMPNLPAKLGKMELKLAMSANVAQKVLNVLPDGGAKLQVAVRDIQKKLDLGMPLPMPEEDEPEPDTFRITKVSKHGRSLNGIAGGQLSNLESALSGNLREPGAMIILPERGVTVGESWTSTISLAKGLDMHATSTLKSSTEWFRGQMTCLIDQKYEMEVDINDFMKAAGESMAIAADGTLKLTGRGTVYFSQEQGRVIKDATAWKMEINVSGGGIFGIGSQEIKMRMDMNEQMQLAK